MRSSPIGLQCRSARGLFGDLCWHTHAEKPFNPGQSLAVGDDFVAEPVVGLGEIVAEPVVGLGEIVAELFAGSLLMPDDG